MPQEGGEMQPVAARLAAQIRSAMKQQGLSGREFAVRVERLLGRPFPEQYVSRRLSPAGDRPLVTISDAARAMCTVLDLDLADEMCQAIRHEGDPLPDDTDQPAAED